MMIVQNYELIEEVGSGNFATVYKARHRKTNQIFAIKKIRNPINFQAVQNQIDLLKKIKHRNIIRYETDFQFKNKWYIVFEYCGKGDLQSFKNKQIRLPQFFCRNLAFSLVQVLQLLHSHNIVHRDLKLANILINEAYDFKLADFGLSKDNQAGIMGTFCGTPYAMAPQIMNRQSYDEKCDTWALGVMIYQLIYGCLPFLPGKQYGPGIIGVANCIMNSQPKFDESIEVGEDCKNFIRQCLIKSKGKRPKMSELMKHNWIKLGGQSNIRKQFLMNSLQDNSQAIDKVNEMFNFVVSQHIIKLIQYWKLRQNDIKWNIQQINKYFEKQVQVEGLLVRIIQKRIQQLIQKQIVIKIQDKQFRIGLKNINGFNIHIKHIKEILYKKVINIDNINVQRDLIMFITNQATNIEDIGNQKLRLLSYISQLPIKKPLNSQIQININFNEGSIRKKIDKYLQQIKIQSIITSINQHYSQVGFNAQFLLNHSFYHQSKKGDQIQIGQFVSHILQFHSSQRI